MYLFHGAADGTVAEEVWIVDTGGRLTVFGRDGEREQSKLVPEFPATAELSWLPFWSVDASLSTHDG